MRLGEILNTTAVEGYLNDQLRQIELLRQRGYNYIIAYPVSKNNTYINGYSTVYLPVKILYSAGFSFVRPWVMGETTARVVVGKPLQLMENIAPPDGVQREEICRLVATDGEYVFGCFSTNKKPKWIRLGRCTKRRSSSSV